MLFNNLSNHDPPLDGPALPSLFWILSFSSSSPKALPSLPFAVCRGISSPSPPSLLDASMRRMPSLLEEAGSTIERDDMLRANDPLRSHPGLFGTADTFESNGMGLMAGEFVDALL